MLKYWIRDENCKIGTNIFGNVFEVDIDESGQEQFEQEHPVAELVGDGQGLSEEYRPMSLGGDTIYGPAFPFGAE